MSLKLMYITNNPQVALIAEKYGVDRIWVDLETLGKEERQGNVDSVKSHHTVDDIRKIAPLLHTSEMLVRVNPINFNSEKEINEVIAAGADIVMLPMWKSIDDVQRFLNFVNGRTKTVLLLETKEAVQCTDEILKIGGFDEIHIGLNDLHLAYGMKFMFELLTNGTIEMLCKKFAVKRIPYGFGGIAKIGEGLLPADALVLEHYRLGSTRAILSRSFCNTELIKDVAEIEVIFKNNMKKLRDFETAISVEDNDRFQRNRIKVVKTVNEIIDAMRNDK